MEINFQRNLVDDSWDIKTICLENLLRDSSLEKECDIILNGSEGTLNFHEEILTSEEQILVNLLIEQSREMEDNFISIGEKNYRRREYSTSKRLIKETWYHTNNEDGTYSNKVEEIIYTYNSNKLMGYTIKKYWMDGTVRLEENYQYSTLSGDFEAIDLKRI